MTAIAQSSCIWLFSGPADSVTRQNLPRVNKFDRGYIYILELNNSLLKVGSTSDPRERFANLRRGYRATGVVLNMAFVTISHINYRENEQLILSDFEHLRVDGEFFNASAQDITTFIEKLVFKIEATIDEVETKKRESLEAYNFWNRAHGLPEKGE